MQIESIQLNDESQPKYLQLFEQIKQQITEGSLMAGQRLPSIREMATKLGVNSVTIVNAYRLLETNHYITAKKGSGYFISKITSIKSEINFSSDIGMNNHEPKINFASAAPHPSIFPIDSFKECINEVLERDKGFAFGYQESNGYRPLREAISGYLSRNYGISAGNAGHIQIVSGAQQGIDLIGKALLNPGDYVITENPTYDGAVEVFKSRGARIVRVNLDRDGMNTEDLEKKIRICKPKFLYVMTSFQNPTSICYSADKLKELVRLSKQYGFYIVEDDSMSELGYDSEIPATLKALDGDNHCVIYLKSFSKILMPGLRLGCMVIPEKLLEDFTKIKYTSDISSSGLIQRSLDLYFRKGKWDEHLKYMKEIYKGKYEFMLGKLESLGKYGVKYTQPNGGLYFWLRLPAHISARNIFLRCRENGLLTIPSYIFYDNFHKGRDSYLRISFASSSFEQIKQGVAKLEECLMV